MSLYPYVLVSPCCCVHVSLALSPVLACPSGTTMDAVWLESVSTRNYTWNASRSPEFFHGSCVLSGVPIRDEGDCLLPRLPSFSPLSWGMGGTKVLSADVFMRRCFFVGTAGLSDAPRRAGHFLLRLWVVQRGALPVSLPSVVRSSGGTGGIVSASGTAPTVGWVFPVEGCTELL